MDEMVDTARFDAKCAFELFPTDLIALIWSATTPDRSLRTLVIDYHISYVCISDIQNAIDEYHPEFAKELLLVSLLSNKVDDWHLIFSIVEEQPCYYHDHDDNLRSNLASDMAKGMGRVGLKTWTRCGQSRRYVESPYKHG